MSFEARYQLGQKAVGWNWSVSSEIHSFSTIGSNRINPKSVKLLFFSRALEELLTDDIRISLSLDQAKKSRTFC